MNTINHRKAWTRSIETTVTGEYTAWQRAGCWRYKYLLLYICACRQSLVFTTHIRTKGAVSHDPKAAASLPHLVETGPSRAAVELGRRRVGREVTHGAVEGARPLGAVPDPVREAAREGRFGPAADDVALFYAQRSFLRQVHSPGVEKLIFGERHNVHCQHQQQLRGTRQPGGDRGATSIFRREPTNRQPTDQLALLGGT